MTPSLSYSPSFTLSNVFWIERYSHRYSGISFNREDVSFINPPNMATTPCSSILPSCTRSGVANRLATKTSRQAAHSSAEPEAERKYRPRSAADHLAFPSAKLRGTLVEARSNWSLAAAWAGTSSNRSVAHVTNARDC